MSKRYRNGFKRTLCRWTIPTPSTSYRNARSNGYPNPNNHLTFKNSPLPASVGRTNNVRHQRVTYSNTTDKPLKTTNSLCHRRDNIFTFSMSKYKFVIGSRTIAGHGNLPGQYTRRTSFHYRFSVVEQRERNEDQQLQLHQRKFSMSGIQQPKRYRTKLMFSTALPPPTPPNSSISEARPLSHLSNGIHSKN